MALPGPDENNPADVPTDIDKLRKRIDEVTAMYLQGAVSTRPAAGTPGRFFFATDERRVYYDDGSIWNSPYNPPGVLTPFAAAAAPAGWLLCDGAAYPRAEYSALFEAIGTTWGAGDGSSTFNVPDLRGRTPVGAGTGVGLTARALGGKGGEENHALVTAELAAHAHGINDPGHTHNTQASSNTVSGAGPPIASSGVNDRTMTNGALASGTGITLQSTGSGTAHNNMSPFAVVNYLIKT